MVTMIEKGSLEDTELSLALAHEEVVAREQDSVRNMVSIHALIEATAADEYRRELNETYLLDVDNTDVCAHIANDRSRLTQAVEAAIHNRKRAMHARMRAKNWQAILDENRGDESDHQNR
jgi:hypothetical protein